TVAALTGLASAVPRPVGAAAVARTAAATRAGTTVRPGPAPPAGGVLLPRLTEVLDLLGVQARPGARGAREPPAGALRDAQVGVQVRRGVVRLHRLRNAEI